MAEGFTDEELGAMVAAESGGAAALRRGDGRGRYCVATKAIARGEAVMALRQPLIRVIAPPCAADYCPVTTRRRPRAVSMAQKVGEVFERFDSSRRGRWGYVDARAAARVLEKSELSEDNFAGVCEAFGGTASDGLSLSQYLRMHENVCDAEWRHRALPKQRLRYPYTLYRAAPSPARRGGGCGIAVCGRECGRGSWAHRACRRVRAAALPQAVEAQARVAIAWAFAAEGSTDVAKWVNTLWVPEDADAVGQQALLAVQEGSEAARTAMLREGVSRETGWLVQCLLAARYNAFGVNVPAPLSRLPVPVYGPSVRELSLVAADGAVLEADGDGVRCGGEPVTALSFDEESCRLTLHPSGKVASVPPPDAVMLTAALRSAAAAHGLRVALPAVALHTLWDVPVHGEAPAGEIPLLNCGLQVYGVPSLVNHSDEPSLVVEETEGSDGPVMVLRSTRDVAEGDELTIRYGDGAAERYAFAK
eukprot:TRINITY_DN29673_c0_g1_i1.p1 TRINITY_DN29673_c0_g1~~TRINITY_DN29673_c0_g1_i1.p1  ORF type:complete len:477 (+),score=144.03 TRINITY_DN29673_c0_g1_i1:58-1488(+)